MKGKLGKKIAVFTIITALVVAMLPVLTFATGSNVAKIGDTGYSTLAAAVSAVNDGETITLLSDLSNQSTNLSKNNIGYTLDLNNKTLSYKPTGYIFSNVSNGKTVTFKNGKMSVDGSSLPQWSPSCEYLFGVTNSTSTLSFDNVELSFVNITNPNGTDWYIFNLDNGKIEFNKSKLEVKDSAQVFYATNVQKGAINAKDSEFLFDNISDVCFHCDKVTLDNSKVTSTNSTNASIFAHSSLCAKNKSVVTIDKSYPPFYGGKECHGETFSVDSTSKVFTTNSHTYGINFGIVTISENADVSFDEKVTIIKEANIASGHFINGIVQDTGAKITLTGGYYKDDVAEFCATGYECVSDTSVDGCSYKVQPMKIAQIGDKIYSTIEDAFSAATAGQTIKLLKNTTLDLDIAVDKKITLDLDGKNIKTNGYKFNVDGNSANFTITGNGTVDNDVVGLVHPIFNVTNSGKFTMENGTFNTKSIQAVSVDNAYFVMNEGTINFTYVEGYDTKSAINGMNNSTLDILGGTINCYENHLDYYGMYGIYVQTGTTLNLGVANKTGPTIRSYYAPIATNGSTTPVTINVYSGDYHGYCDVSNSEAVDDMNVIKFASQTGNGSNLTISGGIFTQHYSDTNKSLSSVIRVNYEANKNITISGGKFKCGDAIFSIGDDNSNTTISISDGYFSNNVDSAYVAEGYSVINNDGSKVSKTDYPYTIGHKVTFSGNGGEPVSKVIEVKHNEKVSKATVKVPTLDKNRFVGWVDETTGKQFLFDEAITKDVNVKANWLSDDAKGKITVKDTEKGIKAETSISKSDIPLTVAEKEAVEAGKTIDVNLIVQVEKAEEAGSDDVKAIEKLMSKDQKVGMYLDCSLLKKLGDEEPVAIEETLNPITITLTVPENLRADGRVYSIVRVHNEKAETLFAGKADKNWKISFETDKFSTYALLYKAENPKTGDLTNIILYLCLGGLALFGIVNLLIELRKRSANKR